MIGRYCDIIGDEVR